MCNRLWSLNNELIDIRAYVIRISGSERTVASDSEEVRIECGYLETTRNRHAPMT